MDRFEHDVIVVGSGIAGLSAAVAAAETGASVAIVERAPPEEAGGNTRYTESFWRMKSHDEVADDFADRLAENAGGWIDPSMVREASRPSDDRAGIVRAQGFLDPDFIDTWGRAAGPTLRWLEGFGVRFDFLPSYFLTQSTTRLAPVGGGLALIEALGEHARSHADRIAFFHEITARELVQSPNGAVVGIRAVDGHNRPLLIHANGVVLACGGFEGNPEMLGRYLGAQAQWIRPVARGGYYNRGEGIRMALALGAAPGGDFSSFHAQPVDPRSGIQEPVVLTYCYGILVNRRGERFTDEAPASVDATYEAVSREIWRQPEGIAWAILDAGLDDVPGWQRAVRTDQPAIEAPTFSALAERLGIDAGGLEATAAAFDAACPDPTGFRPFEPDGLATQGLAPRKSNWARRLDRPPYRAWPIIAANCFTFGGLKCDPRARVLNMDGAPIPGLYAAGETMGVYFRTYPGSTSVMRGAVFGRIAGSEAARRNGR